MINCVYSVVLAMELLLLSYQDIRKRRISIYLLIAMLILSAIMDIGKLYICGEEIDFMSKSIGMIFGAAIMLLGYYTKLIGVGDGVVIVIITLVLDGIQAVAIFLFAITMAAVTSVFLLVIKKVNRKYEIPFIPFLFFSFMGVLACT